LLNVEPIYGYGWSAAGIAGSRNTPAPFTARATDSADEGWAGKVEMPGHEFDGQALSMVKRHTFFDGAVTVVLDGVANGWALIG
jgi:hypothetical protein